MQKKLKTRENSQGAETNGTKPNGSAHASKPAARILIENELLKTVCVYCGSGKGHNPKYAEAAVIFGKALAKSGIGLVYGGGSLGLMGEVARSVLDSGGRVTGIIPKFLSEREKMLKDADEIVLTKDMHERKRIMFDRSDAFVALPGGIGTLEELVEQLTWSQLGRHDKPIVLANIDRFWDPLLGLLDHMRREAFIREGLEVRFHVVNKASEIVPALLKAARGKKREAAPAEMTSKM